jgi:hypothetical protein
MDFVSWTILDRIMPLLLHIINDEVPNIQVS